MKASPPALPVPVDPRAALRRLAREEEALRSALARLEERVRRFEDVELPAYEAWLRLELGPLFADLAERTEEWRARDLFVARIEELIDVHGLDPREALHVATAAWSAAARPGRRARAEGAAARGAAIAAERAEIEARRRAKLERKRAARKEARRARVRAERATAATAGGERSGRRVTALYRALARRLHPDSPTAIVFRDPLRGRAVWMEVQAAYAARSLERLLAISAWIDGGDAAGSARERGALLSFAERHDRLRALRRSCRALERRLDDLVREPAWEFPAASGGARRKLRQAAAERLGRDVARVEEALGRLDAFVAAIGAPRRPRRGGRRRG